MAFMCWVSRPSGFPLEEFLVALTRLNNGSVPSLRQSLAELKTTIMKIYWQFGENSVLTAERMAT
jgi:hypothetical protein